jgi:hypothetical protein
MKSIRIVLLGLGILGLAAEWAQAQTFAPPTAPRAPRPTLSPYLNLLDQANSPTFNYYNRVRPRQEFDAYRQTNAQNLRSLERRVDQNQQALQQSQNSQLTPTGHTTRFLDLGGYFGTNSARNFGGR